MLAYLNPIHTREMREYGYLGVFLITLVGTAAMVVPVPYIVAIAMAGTWGLNPLAVAVVAGVAAALGELTGYAAGYAGSILLPDNRWIHRLEAAMRRFGALVIFIAAFIPNPFFDAVGVIAGATRTRLSIFCGSCFAGKALRFWAIAAGSNAVLGMMGHSNLLG